jgi:hypothetical protein
MIAMILWKIVKHWLARLDRWVRIDRVGRLRHPGHPGFQHFMLM